MKKPIHFGPPLNNHSHDVSIESTGSFLNTIILSSQLILAALLLPLSWLLKTQICIGVKPMETLGQKFLRSKDKAKFAKDWNENLLKEMGPTADDKFLALAKGTIAILEGAAEKKQKEKP